MNGASGLPALRKVLREARERIQVNPDELKEARRRRDLIRYVLRQEFGSDSRTYTNGSVAHRDALTPLTDVDLGIVVPNPDGEFGLYANGPGKLQDRAANAIRDKLKEEFPSLRVYNSEKRKRSVFVSFGAPVDPDEKDFTADVIIALDHPWAGLWIPNHDSWDRSDPETHTRLVREAHKSSNDNFARTIRLLKHWSRRHSKPLCSWNIKALGLASLSEDMDQLDGMMAWFDHAINDLAWRDTPDPAGVAGSISIPGDRTELVRKLTAARAKLKEAIDYANDGYDVLAVQALATFFNDRDMLPPPPEEEATKQQVKRQADLRAKTATTASAVVAAPLVRDRTPVRSWAP
ncbi:hypothetical protein H4P1_00049 (plasmid) [Variovorax sp. PBS-H4]|uniref:nucleotidyltransferase n=1 Tax=Variovorax sp. PBS-H4 TaxID=434008 RepID=UPI0013197F12|nr:nucleotidyltransferase [Variovorax sp. PBS-H4]VTU41417.1 hypothetical protein H4P1_00049 [Variovorax sp. PBS-H4]